jgi:predicted Fe-Mo cluster-binding NifX family protein
MLKRIAITVTDSPQEEMYVADHFGRCSRFLVYEVDNQKKVVREESYRNPLLGNHGGVCELPSYIKELGANVVIAGGMGRRAIANFGNFNIEVVTAPGAKVIDVIYAYLQGELQGYHPCTGHKGDCHS